jgi:hypothetical protein
MRRNTKGTKWVASKDNDLIAQRPGPSKNVTLKTQQSHHKSHAATILEERGEGETLHSRAQSPTLKASIYDAADLRELPNTYARLPSVRSWSSLRSDTYDDEEAVSPRTVTPLRRVSLQLTVSSLHAGLAPWRSSSVSVVEPIDFSSTEAARKGSNVTVFPSFPSTIKRSEEKAADTKGITTPSNIADMLRNARKIYDVGPKGEGQKLWSTYKRIRKDKPNHTEVTQEPVKQTPAPRRPSQGLSAHPPRRPAPSLDRLPLRKAIPPDGTRKGSEVSRSSVEVPIRIENDVEHVVDRARPLPLVPKLAAAPKSRQPAAMKPLPALPNTKLIHSAPAKPLPAVPRIDVAPKRRLHEGRKHKDLAAHIGFVSTDLPYPTDDPKPKQETSTSPPNKSNHIIKPSQWWRSLADFTSETHIPSNPKANISRPRPFTALQNGLTANLAAEHGGVGGPGAASRLPNQTATLPSPDNHSSSSRGLSDRALGKQKLPPHTPLYLPKHWREKLHVERRRSSDDLSFACVGVGEAGPSRARQVTGGSSGASGASARSVGMVPAPLFTGRRRGRDTEFYGFYGEVLDEYRG